MIVSVKPKEIGIPKDFKIPQININGCPGNLCFGLESFTSAHTHITPEDPHFKNVCFLDARNIILPSGIPHDMLCHEYGHVLSLEEGHGPKWEKSMKEIGRPDINGPLVYLTSGEIHIDILTKKLYRLEGLGFQGKYVEIL